jgi:membrane-bound metal-dependent hydrolase YbcI (DUF457 family)
MPLAVTHVLLTIIIVDLYRDYVAKHKKYFSLHTILLAGVAGLLPDIDIPLKMLGDLFNFNIPLFMQHGGITHTLLFAVIFLIPVFILLKKEKHKAAMIFFVISFGIFFHLFLDWLLGGGGHYGIMWLFPLNVQASSLSLLSMFGLNNLPEALDAVILLAWLWHEEIRHKISDFI